MNDIQLAAEIDRRLRLPYHRVISGDQTDGYIGHIAEFAGCYTSGDSAQEAFANLTEAMTAWLESCLVSGDPIPDPAAALAPVA